MHLFMTTFGYTPGAEFTIIHLMKEYELNSIIFECIFRVLNLFISMRIAVFPGSFDPITIGHVDIIYKALPLFDKFIIAIGINTQKKSLFSLEQREEWIKEVFKNEPKIIVDHFEGLTADYARKISAHYLVRGLRNGSDFDYEKTISQVNKVLNKDLETMFFISSPEVAHISSTVVREIISGGGDASSFIPKAIKPNVT